MTPLGFEGSDGLRNLTERLIAVQLVRARVYVAFHGTLYPAHRVRKDRTHGASFGLTWNGRSVPLGVFGVCLGRKLVLIMRKD